MNSNEFPKIKNDVIMNVFKGSKAFLETPTLLHRVEGDHLDIVKAKLLPKLDGATRVEQMIEELSGHMDSETVLAILNELDRSNLLQVEGCDSEQNSRMSVGICGDDDLGQLMAPLLMSKKTIHLTKDLDKADLNLLATRSLLDPSAAAAQKQLLKSPTPHIVFGLDFDGNGFVGPYRDNAFLGACLVCIRTRLLTNAADSETRSEYAQLIEEAYARPLLHSPTEALAAAITSWVFQRMNAVLQRRSKESTALTLIACDTLEATHHPLLPVPTCPQCEVYQSETSKAQFLDLDGAVDDKVGIVHSVDARPSRSGPTIHLSGTTSADLRIIRPSMRAANNGGAGFTKRDALNAGIGESVERYCAGVYKSNTLILSTWNDLDAEAVHPTQFARLSEAQLAESGRGFEAFTEDTPIRWTSSIRLRDGATVFVPASQVYLPYRRVRGETPIGQSISTGQAAGPSKPAAILGGLREVIERDALAISWMHRLPPRQLDPNVMEESPTLRRHLDQRSDWDVRFFDLSLDDASSSVVAVMEQGNGKDRVLTFGSACRDHPSSALEKAFLEAAQGISFVRRLLQNYVMWNPGERFENVTGFNEHAILYSKFPELRSKVNYLLTRNGVPSTLRPCRPTSSTHQLDDGEQLDCLIEHLYRSGYETYVVDLTTPDAAMLGVHVVKVLVPGYVHVAGSHTDRLLGSHRLTSVPNELGFSSTPDNPFPHPLP